MSVPHPVANWTVTEFAKLRAEVEVGNVRAVRGTGELDGLVLYTYTDACTYGRQWNEINKCARGLILDERDPANIHVVALPFPKFFNYGEVASLPDESFTVTDKLDGSLGIVFWWNGKWRVATKGSFTSEQARWAEAWLDDHPNIGVQLYASITYLVEIIYPANRIVVSYGYEALVLIGAYDLVFLDELGPDELNYESRFCGLPLVPYSKYPLGELLDLCRTLPASQEGFVVRFNGGLRVKIKGDEYCRVHRLLTHLTPLGVWEMLLNRDDIESVRMKLPEEFWVDFDRLTNLLRQRLSSALGEIADVYMKTLSLTPRDLGILQRTDHGMSAIGMSMVFQIRKYEGWAGFTAAFEMGGCDRLSIRGRIFEAIRPTGNVLEGYVPSTVMNRFKVESS